jgi:transcriptional regulator
MPLYTNVRIKILQRAARNVERSYRDLMLENAMNVRVRVESGESIEDLLIH